MVTSYQDIPTSTVLIVEDDEDTADVVCAVLANAGFQAVAVDTGAAAVQLLGNQNPHLILLDLNLPDMSGLEVLRQIRARSFVPMIVLSGFGRDRDRVQALEAGADDYIGKPFSPEELVARVRALLRRVEWTPKPETHLQVRQLELDMPRRQALIKSRRLHLTPIEYGILVTLMKRCGQVVTHDDLLKAVWGDSYDGDFSVLRVNISRLRQKIEDNPRHPTYIVTVAGQGYWMPLQR